jgi:hypothetical protein
MEIYFEYMEGKVNAAPLRASCNRAALNKDK